VNVLTANLRPEAPDFATTLLMPEDDTVKALVVVNLKVVDVQRVKLMLKGE
jgi:hypothetical protein